MRLLIVKTSSLGDLIHTLPALGDAARSIPGLSIDWLVETRFSDVPSWHPAVRRVFQCDLRSWRHQPLSAGLQNLRRLRKSLREASYDLIIDAQGLVKSAALARLASGPVAGPGRGAREPLAALLYSRRIAVPQHDKAHAVARLRGLFADALGYALDGRDADFGLNTRQFPQPALAAHFQAPYAILLHGTTWPAKRWPEDRWSELGRTLSAHGMKVVLPWGSATEKSVADRIAAGCGGVVLPGLGLTALAGWLAHARLVVGVDTGLAHLAAALGTPQISLYGPTLPELTGAIGANQVWLRSGADPQIDRLRPTRVEVSRVEEALRPWLATDPR